MPICSAMERSKGFGQSTGTASSRRSRRRRRDPTASGLQISKPTQEVHSQSERSIPLSVQDESSSFPYLRGASLSLPDLDNDLCLPPFP